MNETTHIRNRSKSRAGEAGYVLIIVLMLILMFTGLGVLAMRHTRQELRSAGAYLDATQAADLVRGALSLVATDLRSSSDYYEYKFLETESSDGGVDEVDGVGTYQIPLNNEQFANSECTGSSHPGCINYLSSLGTETSPTGSLYGDDPSNLKGLYGTNVETYVTQRAPGVGPCPPGFSCFDDQNYGWYVFTVDAVASYGAQGKTDGDALEFELGRARGRGRMTVGPISVFGK